ncbi:MAG: right-handed parallel beta-helix repeat-containing protein [Clostridia bacterium]|nr:right-handed parallel beta-helix repeat-containing protein [Clostridia bacterium]
MKTYIVTDYGLTADGVTCNSAAMAALLANIYENAEIVFPAGRYYFSKQVDFLDKKNITLRGEGGAVLISHFGPAGDPKDNNNLWHFNRVQDVNIVDFTVTTDAPIGWAGVVIDVNAAQHYYDVRLYDEFPVTGLEHPVALNSCDAEGTPDYIYGGGIWLDSKTVTIDGKEHTRLRSMDYDVIGDHIVRFYVPETHDLSCLPVGEQMCYRFIVYGSTDFLFFNAERVLLKNIEIERSSSCGAWIGPRSADFTFDNFNIRLRKDTKALYAGNADGIHIAGLTGYLHMYNCHFNGLGDDTLNIHGQAGEITEIREDGSMKLQHRFRNGLSPLRDQWARAGDVIEVYDPETFVCKGKLTLASYQDGEVTVSATAGEYAVGDAIANTAFFAATHLRGCEARNTRARGFLLQTHNILVEDCHVWGMSLPSIIISPDIKVWFEVGPSENVIIRNNVFEKCAFIKSAANLGAIVVKGCHDAGADDYPAGVHRNVQIYGNTFRGMGNSGIYVSATDGVRIEDNVFENCSIDRFNRRKKSPRYDVVTRNCDNVIVRGNKTTKEKKYLFYPKGCKNVTEK